MDDARNVFTYSGASELQQNETRRYVSSSLPGGVTVQNFQFICSAKIRRTKLTRRGRRRVEHCDVDVRHPHGSFGPVTFLAESTVARSPPVLRAAAAASATSERLTGNHFSRLAVRLLRTHAQWADLLSTYADRQGVDISVTVCFCLFVRTVTDFSGEDKASGIKFCMVVHGRHGQGISHFGELCSPRSPKSDESASHREVDFHKEGHKQSTFS